MPEYKEQSRAMKSFEKQIKFPKREIATHCKPDGLYGENLSNFSAFSIYLLTYLHNILSPCIDNFPNLTWVKTLKKAVSKNPLRPIKNVHWRNLINAQESCSSALDKTYLEDFSGFSTSCPRHRWNRTRLLSPGAVCITCLALPNNLALL